MMLKWANFAVTCLLLTACTANVDSSGLEADYTKNDDPVDIKPKMLINALSNPQELQLSVENQQTMYNIPVVLQWLNTILLKAGYQGIKVIGTGASCTPKVVYVNIAQLPPGPIAIVNPGEIRYPGDGTGNQIQVLPGQPGFPPTFIGPPFPYPNTQENAMSKILLGLLPSWMQEFVNTNLIYPEGQPSQSSVPPLSYLLQKLPMLSFLFPWLKSILPNSKRLPNLTPPFGWYPPFSPESGNIRFPDFPLPWNQMDKFPQPWLPNIINPRYPNEGFINPNQQIPPYPYPSPNPFIPGNFPPSIPYPWTPSNQQFPPEIINQIPNYPFRPSPTWPIDIPSMPSPQERPNPGTTKLLNLIKYIIFRGQPTLPTNPEFINQPILPYPAIPNIVYPDNPLQPNIPLPWSPNGSQPKNLSPLQTLILHMLGKLILPGQTFFPSQFPNGNPTGKTSLVSLLMALFSLENPNNPTYPQNKELNLLLILPYLLNTLFPQTNFVPKFPGQFPTGGPIQYFRLKKYLIPLIFSLLPAEKPERPSLLLPILQMLLNILSKSNPSNPNLPQIPYLPIPENNAENPFNSHSPIASLIPALFFLPFMGLPNNPIMPQDHTMEPSFLQWLINPQTPMKPTLLTRLSLLIPKIIKIIFPKLMQRPLPNQLHFLPWPVVFHSPSLNEQVSYIRVEFGKIPLGNLQIPPDILQKILQLPRSNGNNYSGFMILPNQAGNSPIMIKWLWKWPRHGSNNEVFPTFPSQNPYSPFELGYPQFSNMKYSSGYPTNNFYPQNSMTPLPSILASPGSFYPGNRIISQPSIYTFNKPDGQSFPGSFFTGKGTVYQPLISSFIKPGGQSFPKNPGSFITGKGTVSLHSTFNNPRGQSFFETLNSLFPGKRTASQPSISTFIKPSGQSFPENFGSFFTGKCNVSQPSTTTFIKPGGQSFPGNFGSFFTGNGIVSQPSTTTFIEPGGRSFFENLGSLISGGSEPSIAPYFTKPGGQSQQGSFQSTNFYPQNGFGLPQQTPNYFALQQPRQQIIMNQNYKTAVQSESPLAFILRNTQPEAKPTASSKLH